MENSKSILLFGGTFDPVHNGHLIVSRAAAEQLDVDKVILIPSAVPPHKSSDHVSPAQHRLEMVRLAVQSEDMFEVSDCELHRDGPSYTLDTVRHFRNIFEPPARLYWLIGADSITELVGWYRVKELADECTIVTACRGNSASKDMESLQQVLEERQIDHIREFMLDTPRIDISATEIRRRVAQNLSIQYLLPPKVQKYIYQQEVYKNR